MSLLFRNIAQYYDLFMNLMGLSNEQWMLNYMDDVTGLNIADIGGGTGTLAALLADRGAEVTIFDPVSTMTDIAKRKNENIRVMNAYAEAIPDEYTEYFHIVCIRDCLHHIESQSVALGEAVRILRKDGSIIVQEFSPECIRSRLIQWLERRVGEKTTLVDPANLKQILLKLSVRGQLHYRNKMEYIFVGCKFE